jgi:hypothetical protein
MAHERRRRRARPRRGGSVVDLRRTAVAGRADVRRRLGSVARSALAELAADEVVVVTRPDEEATWLEERGTEDLARALNGVEVTRIVVSDR